MSDSTPERDRAKNIQERFAVDAKRLREDPDITDEARRRQLAEKWKTARKQLDDLQAMESRRLARREQELERRLFGAGTLDGASHAISMRDAQDRANRLASPADATDLLSRAERNGDQVLARAVAYHAVQQSPNVPTREAAEWDRVIGMFIDARPETSPVVEELAAIERLSIRQVFSEFSLPQPHGVLPADINTAEPAQVSA